MKTFKSKLEKPVHSDLNPELLMFLNYFQIYVMGNYSKKPARKIFTLVEF